jgi:hypothetical protein
MAVKLLSRMAVLKHLVAAHIHQKLALKQKKGIASIRILHEDQSVRERKGGRKGYTLGDLQDLGICYLFPFAFQALFLPQKVASKRLEVQTPGFGSCLFPGKT